MVDAIVTLVMDAQPHWSRTMVVTSIVVFFLLLSLPYCTEFGYYLLTGVDRWINDVALVFVVWAECVAATTVYRWRDVAGQVGLAALIIYNTGYFGGMILGVAMAHTVSPVVGAGVGFGLFIICTIISVVVGKTPDSPAPKCWRWNTVTRRMWYLAFYSVRLLHFQSRTPIQGRKRDFFSLSFYFSSYYMCVKTPLQLTEHSHSGQPTSSRPQRHHGP